jgi:hypothetical protein
MTELDTVTTLQLVPLRQGVQQPSTVIYNEALHLLIGKKNACTPDRLLFQHYTRVFRSWKEIAEPHELR